LFLNDFIRKQPNPRRLTPARSCPINRLETAARKGRRFVIGKNGNASPIQATKNAFLFDDRPARSPDGQGPNRKQKP
jgi:hypothetical protein